MKAQAEKTSKEGAAFLVVESKKPGVQKTASGLLFSSITEGKGAQPKATDKVKVHYRGTLINGKEFDSSYARKKPAEFPLNRVIPCWTEGVQKMKVGGKARLVCPSKIAYGERGTPGIPPSSTLIFEVELLEVSTPPPPKKTDPRKAKIGTSKTVQQVLKQHQKSKKSTSIKVVPAKKAPAKVAPVKPTPTKASAKVAPVKPTPTKAPAKPAPAKKTPVQVEPAK